MPLLFISIFAFLFAAFSALHGMDADQMILYQAGLKLLDGQILYRDFYLPHGPLGTLTMAFFLTLAKTGGFSILIASGVLNTLATLCIWDITRRHTDSLRYPVIASILTAIWFLPVFGALYYDHLSYFFVLLAFVFYSRVEKNKAYAALAAVSLVIAFHYKQTVGLPGLVAFWVARLLSYGKKDVLSKNTAVFAASYALGNILILSLIAFYSELSHYFLYTFSYPLDLLFSGESPKKLFTLLEVFLFPYGIHPLKMLLEAGWGRIVFYPVVLLVYFAYWVLIKKELSTQKRFALLFLLFSTLLCSALLGRLFAHLFFGMGGVLALSLSALSEKVKKPYECFVFFLIACLGVFYVNQLRPFSEKGDPSFKETDLYPIRIEESPLSTSSKNVIFYLKKSPGSLALLNDTAYLVPLALRQATLNSAVLYHDGLTIPLAPEKRESWEQETILCLENLKVQYIIASTPIESGFRTVSSKTREIVPVLLLEDYLKSHYKPILNEFAFTLYLRN